MTFATPSVESRLSDFNPHEREARDQAKRAQSHEIKHFNPHEREARDLCHAQRHVVKH